MFGEKFSIKKLNIISVIVGVFILLVVIGGGYYWWTGTPEYSLFQIKKAIKTHNPELGLKYVNSDTVFENFWLDTKSELLKGTEEAEGFEALGMMFGLQLAESMKPAMKEQVKEGIKNWFSAPAEEKSKETITTKENLELGTIWQQRDIQIKKQSNSAYIELPNNIKIIFFKKEGERYWVVSKIEGFTEKFPTTENIKTTANSSSQEETAPKITLEITNKGFHEADFMSGDYQTQITMDLKFTNETDKEIKGVEGVLTFFDIFDNKISATKISYDKGIPASQSKVWKSGIDFNQFMDEDIKLKNTELEDLKYKWEVSTIIYADGNKEIF